MKSRYPLPNGSNFSNFSEYILHLRCEGKEREIDYINIS
jgi:hypothetical protein